MQCQLLTLLNGKRSMPLCQVTVFTRTTMPRRKPVITLAYLERELREGLTRLDTLIQALNKDLRDNVLTTRKELRELKTVMIRRLDWALEDKPKRR